MFDSSTEKINIFRNLQNVLAERTEQNTSKRGRLLASHTIKYKMFLWCGLQNDESGEGLFAKNTVAAYNTSATVMNGRLESQYIHLTKNTEVVIYYAAAFCSNNSPCRIAQVDMSKGIIEDVLDLSNGEKLTSQAPIFAKAHGIILVREHIPARAVTIRTILPKLSIPRGVRGGALLLTIEKCSKEIFFLQTFSNGGIKSCR